jgi:hypothetical protein
MRRPGAVSLGQGPAIGRFEVPNLSASDSASSEAHDIRTCTWQYFWQFQPFSILAF